MFLVPTVASWSLNHFLAATPPPKKERLQLCQLCDYQHVFYYIYHKKEPVLVNYYIL